MFGEGGGFWNQFSWNWNSEYWDVGQFYSGSPTTWTVVNGSAVRGGGGEAERWGGEGVRVVSEVRGSLWEGFETVSLALDLSCEGVRV